MSGIVSYTGGIIRNIRRKFCVALEENRSREGVWAIRVLISGVEVLTAAGAVVVVVFVQSRKIYDSMSIESEYYGY